jgi:hypothetical protein
VVLSFQRIEFMFDIFQASKEAARDNREDGQQFEADANI